ncbi:MAG: nucleoside triphosphate pyrophosphohydrolase, partial [Aliifodinibius sp.]|nr:nucleoside triphosphate pyrophosphohydrolase [Fodinibius sp.]NIV10706.1 nucleoside triphosphate pyrophosphohydrolase [Fodinibius sp.]NIY24327.1 nucleoside triphosphate pyrophosphohydrolase [Fodinibius sp.]
ISRHPHIYGDVNVQDEEEVKQNWEKIKLKENGNKSVLGGVPKSLPALVKSMRIQEKARGVGFDWDNKDQVWEKV